MTIDDRVAATTRRRSRDDDGDTMLMATIFISFLMLGSWALVSGSEQWGARRDVQAAAAAAARAGAQPSVEEVRGGIVELDPSLAQARANGVLASAGYSGTVNVTDVEVIVIATGSVSYTFPAPGFPGALTARASADAVNGVVEAGG